MIAATVINGVLGFAALMAIVRISGVHFSSFEPNLSLEICLGTFFFVDIFQGSMIML